jgi:hypothetical protein
MWGTSADASAWGLIAPVWGHRGFGTETTPTVAALRSGMAEEVLLELVAPHGAPTETALGNLAPPLLPWGPLDPTWGHRLAFTPLVGTSSSFSCFNDLRLFLAVDADPKFLQL